MPTFPRVILLHIHSSLLKSYFYKKVYFVITYSISLKKLSAFPLNVFTFSSKNYSSFVYPSVFCSTNNTAIMYCSTNYSTKSLYISQAVRQVSLVEQNTIDYVSTTYFEPKKVLKNQTNTFIKEIKVS